MSIFFECRKLSVLKKYANCGDIRVEDMTSQLSKFDKYLDEFSIILVKTVILDFEVEGAYI